MNARFSRLCRSIDCRASGSTDDQSCQSECLFPAAWLSGRRAICEHGTPVASRTYSINPANNVLFRLPISLGQRQ